MELRTRDALGVLPRPTTECAQCGTLILSSSWSEAVNGRRVRDVWDCLICGYTFETEAVLPKKTGR